MNKKLIVLYSVLFLGVGVLITAGFTFFNFPNSAFVSLFDIPTPTHEALWALVNVPKPAAAPTNTSTPTPLIEEPVSSTATPVEAASGMVMEIVDENDSSTQYQPQDDSRWIDVNLSEQQVYVYEGDVLVNSFLVSTGLPDTPTVTGEYRIYIKVPIQDMSGPGYYLRDVPWVMYFYDEYGFHGTYWHNNFGTPMSRGCVNLRVDDAAWLYNWASVGTRVSVHY